MSGDPDHFHTVSLKLSEVLSDIGVNGRTILKRRRMVLLKESVRRITYKLNGEPFIHYNFGSQSEGSTTIGLLSDTDALFCLTDANVIKEWSEWQHGMFNPLMIQDDTTSPGYCLLQVLREDEPLPLHISEYALDVGIVKEREGRVLLKHTIFKQNVDDEYFNAVNGPAISSQGVPGFSDYDFVRALLCKSWPVEAQQWLERESIGIWPTQEMKTYCENTGCFLVPVCSKSGQNEEVEWRISTSLAERHLMFSLNITQMRCYILMKMILKTFINPQCNGVLSSFICKTVLFHCIHNTCSNNWQPSNLLACLTCCLIILEKFVRQIHCPHFIIPGNNLMAGRISSCNKHKIIEVLQTIIRSEGRKLLEIPVDNLGNRLHIKMNMFGVFQFYCTSHKLYAHISEELLINIGYIFSRSHKQILNISIPGRNDDAQERFSDLTFRLMAICRANGCKSSEKSALKLLIPMLYSSQASVLASSEIYTDGVISRKSLAYFSIGVDSDVSSGRLKLASAMYCLGDMIRTEFVLRKTEDMYDLNNVEPVCCCRSLRRSPHRQGFADKSTTGNEEIMREVSAFCVRFTRNEINCVPQELRYEMFRSTQEDMIGRYKLLHCWMDWAVVDSLPYLYFLQYKTYGHLERAAEQQQALTNLVITIETEPNLSHRETALNLLGQCMEQENRHNDALRCYILSLNIHARNNAANFLMAMLLYAFDNRHVV